MIKFSSVLAVGLSILAFSHQPARAQAVAAGDIFESSASVNVDPKTGRLDHVYSKYAWAALEERAKKAASEGFTGEAEYLFEQARIYALQMKDDSSKQIIGLQEQARFDKDLGIVEPAVHLYGLAYEQYQKLKKQNKSLPVDSRTLTSIPGEKAELLLSEYATILNLTSKVSESDAILHERDSLLRERRAAEDQQAKKKPIQTAAQLERDADIVRKVDRYMDALRQKVKDNWTPLRSDSEQIKIVAVFKVQKEGAVSNLRLDHPSKSETANKSAIKAIESAAPFAQLPAESGEDIDVQFTFDTAPVTVYSKYPRMIEIHSRHFLQGGMPGVEVPQPDGSTKIRTMRRSELKKLLKPFNPQ